MIIFSDEEREIRLLTVLLILKISEQLLKEFFIISLVIVVSKALSLRFLINTGGKIYIKIFESTSVLVIDIKSE